MVKLLMSWNIRQGRESEYFEFIVQEFGPELAKLGVKVTEAWYTAYGERPQILTGGVVEDLDTMRGIVATEEWRTLKVKLLTYVTDYKQKIIRASGGFQL